MILAAVGFGLRPEERVAMTTEWFVGKAGREGHINWPSKISRAKNMGSVT